PARAAIYDWLRAHQGPRCAWPGCDRPWDDPHEVLTRGRGGSHIDREVIIGLCREHNHEATNTAPAQCIGVVVPSWVVAGFPGRVPAAMEVARQLRLRSVRDEAPPCPW